MSPRAGILALGLAGGLAFAAQAASGTVPSGIPPADFAAFAFAQHPGAALPLDTVLRAPGAGAATLRSLIGGKPAVLDFEYDRCTVLCGVVLDQITAALGSLPLAAGIDYRLVAIDIDPAATPQQVEDFARAHGAARPGMAVATGDAAAIGEIAAAAGFPYRRDEAGGQYAHPAGFIIVTPEGTISRYFLGFDWRPLDLRLALAEAAGRRIAPPAAQVLLFCYHYDPQTGRYDLAVGRLLQVFGAATLLVVAGAVGLAARRAAR